MWSMATWDLFFFFFSLWSEKRKKWVKLWQHQRWSNVEMFTALCTHCGERLYSEQVRKIFPAFRSVCLHVAIMLWNWNCQLFGMIPFQHHQPIWSITWWWLDDTHRQALLALCVHLISILVKKKFSPPLRPLQMLPRMHGCKSMASSIASHSSWINGKCAAFILRFFFSTFTHCVIHPFTSTFIPWWPRLPCKVPPASPQGSMSCSRTLSKPGDWSGDPW